MYKTFYQQASAQSSLQTTVAGKFGYRLSNQDIRINNNSANKSPPRILASIKPYALREKELPYNQEVQKLNLELQIIKNQRQRDANPSQSNIQVMQMLDQRVHEYNYLLDHKHLSDKDSNETRKILKIQPKTQAQLILQKINKEKEQLINGRSLSISKQYLMNKNMNTLYKQFKHSMFQKKSDRQSFQQNCELQKKTHFFTTSKVASNIGHHGTSFSKGKTKDLTQSMNNPENIKQIKSHSLQSGNPVKDKLRMIKSMIGKKDYQIKQSRKGSSLSNKQKDDIQQIKKQIFGRNKVFQHKEIEQFDSVAAQNQEGSVCYQKLQQKNESSCLIDRSIGQISIKNDNIIDINSPYIKKQLFDKGKQLDRKIKNSDEVIDLWRVRIADSKIQTQKMMRLINSKRKQQFKQTKVKQNQNPQCENIQKQIYITPIQQIERRIKNSSPKKYQEEQNKIQTLPYKIRQKKSSQKKMIASYLQKRNGKFKKPYGNKILIKYDSVMEASSMIDGNSQVQDIHLREKQKQAELALSIMKSRSKTGSRVQVQQMTDLQELQTPNKNVLFLDENHYWAMVKNEKINLLIKSNKH